MKKIIDGSVYNTKTAKMICERISTGPEFQKGADVKKTKQLFKTRSGKFFFFIKKEFSAYVDVNNDDLNPKHEQIEVEDSMIKKIDYKLAFEFAKEVNTDVDSKSKERIAKYFPEIRNKRRDKNERIQKKFYLSQKASWYLEMMLIESEETNSSIIERLIVEEYKKLYTKGIMNRDPYFEMEN